MLVRHVIEAARSCSRDFLWLTTLNDRFFPAANRLYERVGMEIVGEVGLAPGPVPPPDMLVVRYQLALRDGVVVIQWAIDRLNDDVAVQSKNAVEKLGSKAYKRYRMDDRDLGDR